MKGGLYSWGRYPDCPQMAHRPAWPDELAGMLEKAGASKGSSLPYGNGRSYGDSCLADSGHVLAMTGLNRIVAVDWERGVLRAESGILLADILACALPRGWFLPVVPGTRFVTLGGAIANDVHGKNHHRRGTFGCHVTALGLLRNGEEVVCSPEREPELFAATVGGLGLSGVILWAELRLMPVGSDRIEVLTQRFGSLSEFFALSAEYDERHEYAVAWVDCVARRGGVGRGVAFWGDHAAAGRVRAGGAARGASWEMPWTPPVSLVNRWSVAAFNLAYWHRHPAGRERSETGVEPFFFPLDGIGSWNRIYGRKGFQQFQCVVPEASAEMAVGAVLEEVGRSRAGSFLAVLKRCGGVRSPGWLSFPMQGTSLALDFARNPELEGLLGRLDRIVHEAGGRLYPAKDAHMSGADFRAAYPGWEKLEALRDPGLMSRFWRRVLE